MLYLGLGPSPGAPMRGGLEGSGLEGSRPGPSQEKRPLMGGVGGGGGVPKMGDPNIAPETVVGSLL